MNETVSTAMRVRRGIVLLPALLLLPASAHGAEQLEYSVLTPAGYETSQRSYPAVYVVPGSGEDPNSAIKTLRLGSYAARGEAIIVVASESGNGRSNFIVDWFDGSAPLDRSFVRELIPAVDARYRTRPNGRSRAIGGYSAGGYSAMAIASRHPKMFASASSFSGVTDIEWQEPVWPLAFDAANSATHGPDTLFRRWGNPATDDDNWAAQNPAALAERLRGKRGLYIASGDGTPTGADVSDEGPLLGLQVAVERATFEMTRSYHEKLAAAGVAHRYRPHAGVHTASHWREDLSIWWPMAITALRGSRAG